MTLKKKKVTVSESTSGSTNLQGINSQSKGIKHSRIHEKESKSSTAVVKEFENEVDHTIGFIRHIDHDIAHLSLADHDGTSRMPTTTQLNKGCVKLEREIELKVDGRYGY
ncbi:unnamed protein product [Trichobilharzia regenti]|nr:unnamed protein product [Trichobilharzia regenti]